MDSDVRVITVSPGNHLLTSQKKIKGQGTEGAVACEESESRTRRQTKQTTTQTRGTKKLRRINLVIC